MIRGTTAQFKFQLPYDTQQIKSINIVLWQEGYKGPNPASGRKVPIIKTLLDVNYIHLNDYEVTVIYEPEETARLTDTRKAYIQCIATTTEGLRFASDQQEITVDPIYGEDEFTWEDIVLPESPEIIILDGNKI